jgi:CBS domain-containing protein
MVASLNLFPGETMRPILELLKKRDATNFSLAPQDSVFAALQQLADHDVGAMMVLDNGKLVGVFSERDYTRREVFQRHRRARHHDLGRDHRGTDGEDPRLPGPDES